MALTISNLVVRQIAGGSDGSVHRVAEGKATFDSSYPTDGEELSPLAIKLDDIDHLDLTPTSGCVPVADLTNNKIKVFALGTGAEVANGTSLATLSVYFRATENV